eukprot:TRINITY_DN2145_c0_g1_i1.p1 TRINITY_DN2145_c0_g1~~TRINITY_DN2145_c0_g1_i1.p1  ORF type:complete len:871 (-),score=296.37 TRINITY_DN2145_c0_g1_i1:122-2734(-)
MDKATTLADVLLPTNARPRNYKLELTPNFTTFEFQVEEEIDLDVVQETKTITAHAHQLTISSAFVINDEKKQQANVVLQPEQQRVVFEFQESLKAGKKTLLSISFVGILNDQLAGFYRSKYTAVDGTQKYLATTQFEATDARKALVCWDEPAVKATFEVIINVAPELQAISNMPIIKTTKNENGTLKVHFDRSPIMSTYLLAFIVGEFDYLEGKSKEGVTIRVYTPIGKKEQGTFALDVAKDTLSYYAELFEIPYPLPKLDLIAIPDFAAGAMENWGLVTYREARLLIDPLKTTTQIKQATLKTINHELAHMWFGNLVTMQWWTHLWLNEGFARYMEHLPVEKFFPEFEIWNQFGSSILSSALSLDGLQNTHPVEVDVKHPDEINEIFDTISYAKGASIIRMLVEFIGDDFFVGVRKYLKKHQFGNAVTEDLWAALGEASGKPVESIMTTWTKQAGYPVVSISETTSGNTQQGVRSFRLHQVRFLSSQRMEDLDEEEKKKRWNIPISLVSPQEKKTFLMEGETLDVEIRANQNDWIKLNSNHSGFYRTNYSADLLSKLTPHIHSLSTLDRLGILNDAFALVQSGYLSTPQFLELVEFYSKFEDDYAVLSSLISNLSHVRLLIDQSDFFEHFKSFARSVLKRAYEKLGWEKKEGENHLTSLLRTSVISTLGNVSDEAFVAEAKKLFVAFLHDKKPIAADIKSAVFKTVVANGGVEEYETILKLYRESEHVEEKNVCLTSLGGSRNPELLLRTLTLALSSEVRTQDLYYPISAVAANPLGRQLVWDWFKKNFDSIHLQFKEGQNFILSAIINYATSYHVTKDKAEEIKKFFEEHPVPMCKRTITQSLEGINSAAKWLERDQQKIKDWLLQKK